MDATYLVNSQVQRRSSILILEEQNFLFFLWQTRENVPDYRSVPPQGSQMQRSLPIGISGRKSEGIIKGK
jgi:hypothetical protein